MTNVNKKMVFFNEGFPKGCLLFKILFSFVRVINKNLFVCPVDTLVRTNNIILTIFSQVTIIRVFLKNRYIPRFETDGGRGVRGKLMVV